MDTTEGPAVLVITPVEVLVIIRTGDWGLGNTTGVDFGSPIFLLLAAEISTSLGFSIWLGLLFCLVLIEVRSEPPISFSFNLPCIISYTWVVINELTACDTKSLDFELVKQLSAKREDSLEDDWPSRLLVSIATVIFPVSGDGVEDITTKSSLPFTILSIFFSVWSEDGFTEMPLVVDVWSTIWLVELICFISFWPPMELFFINPDWSLLWSVLITSLTGDWFVPTPGPSFRCFTESTGIFFEVLSVLPGGIKDILPSRIPRSLGLDFLGVFLNCSSFFSNSSCRFSFKLLILISVSVLFELAIPPFFFPSVFSPNVFCSLPIWWILSLLIFLVSPIFLWLTWPLSSFLPTFCAVSVRSCHSDSNFEWRNLPFWKTFFPPTLYWWIASEMSLLSLLKGGFCWWIGLRVIAWEELQR